MRRREFITLLGGAAAAWPLAARAQPPLRRVGIFMDLSEQDPEGQARVAAFRKGLQDLGWIEGRNVRFDTRWTGGDPTRMRRLAAEIVSLTPEVIMNGGLPTLVAMQQETHTIPIVFAQVLDPVGALSRAWRAQAEISLDLSASNTRWQANGWKRSSLWRPTSFG
jgi:putative tryptophan/tyrosine transport system substrate-binding protein